MSHAVCASVAREIPSRVSFPLKKNTRRLFLIVISSAIFLLLTAFAGLVGLSTHAASVACPVGSKAYQVVFGDTLGAIAAHSNTTWQTLATTNHLINPNLIFPGQTLCVPNGTTQSAKNIPLHGPGSSGNLYAPGQCTWWADQRYYELHQSFVPWTTNADAWQWKARALDFHWVVSTSPKVGDIIDLAPNVQLASNLGHVAIVESILPNGHVLTSDLNWGATAQQRTMIAYNVEFVPGPGVTFIRQQ